MTPDTVLLFKQLLDQVSLSAAAPDFKEQAARIVKAREEIQAVLSTESEA
jgi:hypothetical protein